MFPPSKAPTNQQQPPGSDAGAQSTSRFAVAPPSISLPKGGSALRGIGEKFAADPATGTGSMTVPIFTSPGRSGFGQLSRSYHARPANEPTGFDWSFSLPAITCETDKAKSL